MKNYIITKKQKRVLGTIFLTGVLLFIWGFFIEPSMVKYNEKDISLKRWPLEKLKIAIIADLHAGAPHINSEAIEALVLGTNSQKPDLVLIAGDIVIRGVVGGNLMAPKDIAKILSGLRAKYGVYAVLGNHDWWHNAREVNEALSSNGITMMDKKFKVIKTKLGSFNLVGFGDFWEGTPDPVSTIKAIDNDFPIIAFTHNPDVFPQIPNRVAITIAGHTHGGQVYIPLVGRPIVPAKNRYAIGHITEDGKHMFVSSGVGTSIIPVRFLVPPEVSILNISGL